jgi:hypothetical protein
VDFGIHRGFQNQSPQVRWMAAFYFILLLSVKMVYAYFTHMEETLYNGVLLSTSSTSTLNDIMLVA